MSFTADELEKFIEHEVDYYSFGADCERTSFAWFLSNLQISDYRELNRALHLRDDGRGPKAVAHEVITYYRSRGLEVTADVDAVAEAQGIGPALRRMGVMPVLGSRLLMSYPLAALLEVSPRGIDMEVVPNDTGADEARLWVQTAICDEPEDEWTPAWQAMMEMEARSTRCRLYLARIDGQAVGACDLFSAGGWGRIDNVMTCPAYRRRGVASCLTARAVADSLSMGHEVTYLYTDANGAGEQVYLRLGFKVRARDILRRHITS